MRNLLLRFSIWSILALSLSSCETFDGLFSRNDETPNSYFQPRYSISNYSGVHQAPSRYSIGEGTPYEVGTNDQDFYEALEAPRYSPAPVAKPKPKKIPTTQEALAMYESGELELTDAQVASMRRMVSGSN